MAQVTRGDKLVFIGVLASVVGAYLIHWGFAVLIVFVVGWVIQAKRSDDRGSSNSTGFVRTVHYSTKQDVKAVRCDIEGHGNYDHEVVGESNYQSELLAPIPPANRSSGSFRLYFVFQLVQEDDNAHDSNAVAVKLGSVVGYLPRSLAKQYRAWAVRCGIGHAATCRGVIVGKPGKDCSVWLDLPL